MSSMIEAHIVDSRGVYIRTVELDPMGPQPPGAVYGIRPSVHEGLVATWSGLEWLYVPPESLQQTAADVKPKVYRRYIGNEKIDLFTPEEQLTVVTATLADPVVKLLYDRLIGAAYMSYEDPETESGLAMLVEKNLLTQERKEAIVLEMTT